MAIILIGIDDTDNLDSPGTGHLARLVQAECQRRGLVPAGVTRHQFLIDPRIPYTTHNSGACVAVAGEGGVEAAQFAFDFVAQRAADGSDPGVCIASADRVSDDIIAFGQAATCQVLEMDQAFQLAQRADIALKALGGTGQGVIGALGSVGLRAGGNEGRFIDLPGLRGIPQRVGAQAFARLGIRLQHDQSRRTPAPDDDYHTLGWIRPRVVGGQAVLPVQWSDQDHAWVPVDRKKSRPLE